MRPRLAGIYINHADIHFPHRRVQRVSIPDFSHRDDGIGSSELFCKAINLAGEQGTLCRHAAGFVWHQCEYHISTFDQWPGQRIERRHRDQYRWYLLGASDGRQAHCSQQQCSHQQRKQRLHNFASLNPGTTLRIIVVRMKKNAASITIAPPDGTGISHCIGIQIPPMQLSVANTIVV